MPELMIFKEMIDENSVPFIALIESEGHYEDDGDYVEGGEPEPVEMVGVILPLSDDDLRYAEGGTYSVKDRKVYTTQALKLGQKIQYKKTNYTVQNFKDYTDFTDVFIYLARWAGNEDSES